MNDKALSDLIEAGKKLEIAHELVLQYRIDLGEIWSGEPMEQDSAQLDFTLDTPKFNRENRTPESFPADKE